MKTFTETGELIPVMVQTFSSWSTHSEDGFVARLVQFGQVVEELGFSTVDGAEPVIKALKSSSSRAGVIHSTFSYSWDSCSQLAKLKSAETVDIPLSSFVDGSFEGRVCKCFESTLNANLRKLTGTTFSGHNGSVFNGFFGIAGRMLRGQFADRVRDIAWANEKIALGASVLLEGPYASLAAGYGDTPELGETFVATNIAVPSTGELLDSLRSFTERVLSQLGALIEELSNEEVKVSDESFNMAVLRVANSFANKDLELRQSLSEIHPQWRKLQNEVVRAAKSFVDTTGGLPTLSENLETVIADANAMAVEMFQGSELTSNGSINLFDEDVLRRMPAAKIAEIMSSTEADTVGEAFDAISLKAQEAGIRRLAELFLAEVDRLASAGESIVVRNNVAGSEFKSSTGQDYSLISHTDFDGVAVYTLPTAVALEVGHFVGTSLEAFTEDRAAFFENAKNVRVFILGNVNDVPEGHAEVFARMIADGSSVQEALASAEFVLN